ncbi:MAG TPA: DUF4124 domain-containing protein [Gammaproteobacteria bacterium]|nr:DUF4124 domain-containing protein [Gammaproteobacteria bacterium]
MKTLLAIFFSTCMTTAWADTPIYKWVDAQGVVHYSTEPHSDSAQPINIVNKGTLPAASTAPAASSANGPGSAAADATLTQPTSTDSSLCKSARETLSKYLHAGQLYQVNNKGEQQSLSATEQQKVLDDARNYVKQACGPGGGQ